MTPAHYWRIRYAIAARDLAVLQADAIVANAIRDAGLDPAKSYQLDDATETATDTSAPQKDDETR
jgi:hypothetical protein